MHRLTSESDWPIFGQEKSRAIEQELQESSDASLMQRAGLAAAQLALAISPHAQRIWIAAGPGNNGGDGIEAALHLHRWGKTVMVTLIGEAAELPTDARNAWQRASDAGVPMHAEIPMKWVLEMTQQDLCIDALLGLGTSRQLSSALQIAINTLNQTSAQILALDLPTGLHPDSGQWVGCTDALPAAVRADHTLSFMTLKPGLLMGQGRDACGEIWLESLSKTNDSQLNTKINPQAQLNPAAVYKTKAHASHKGSHGDVAVIGGEPLALRGMGMTGAALLAATAALNAGAGRVILSLLGGTASAIAQSDLMQRSWAQLNLENLCVVCGCGGGKAVETVISEVLKRSAQLVLDADGLNAVAHDEGLHELLRLRGNAQPTVITPHPLEAARLLRTSTSEVQNNRLQAAQNLAQMFNCTVVLKGSGTVIAAPGEIPRINFSGNGKLATGGTGDVLAGLIGALMAKKTSAFEAACTGVAQHGQTADAWPDNEALTASRLAERLR
jgi:ADP-dependent NAD(P)H-hydrate dehydratase / NAD(P)H-hydrate epimerase